MLRIVQNLIFGLTLWMLSPQLVDAKTSANGAQISDIRIEILFTDDMAARATGRAKKVPAHLRGGANTWRITDFLGEGNLIALAKRTRSKVTRAMNDEGITINQDSENVLWITIMDAIPNEWTIEQIKRMGAPAGGSGIGGATIVGQYYAGTSPDDVHTIPYRHYTGEANTMARGWHDANVAISKFSTLAAKTVSETSGQ